MVKLAVSLLLQPTPFEADCRRLFLFHLPSQEIRCRAKVTEYHNDSSVLVPHPTKGCLDLLTRHQFEQQTASYPNSTTYWHTKNFNNTIQLGFT